MDGKKCHRKTPKNHSKPVKFLTVRKTIVKKDIILFIDNIIKRSIEENPEITDLTEIYKTNFDSIDIKAMEHNLRYKQAIEIYKEYKSIKEAEEEANKILSAKTIQKQ